MGRRTLWSSAFHTVVDKAVLEEGKDFDSACKLAMDAADAAEEDRTARRRARNAERQRRYRARRLKPGVYAEPGDPPKKALTIYLSENDLALLDRHARRMADSPYLQKDLPMSHWRSSVIASLLGSLDNEDREQARKQERNIDSLQQCIQSARSKGESEEDIERHVAESGLDMTVDEIMAYQFQYAPSSALAMPDALPPD